MTQDTNAKGNGSSTGQIATDGEQNNGTTIISKAKVPLRHAKEFSTIGPGGQNKMTDRDQISPGSHLDDNGNPSCTCKRQDGHHHPDCDLWDPHVDNYDDDDQESAL